MNGHRYILEPYKDLNSRYNCPGCKKPKTFSRYIDSTTGQHLHASVGRCNRESNCGYHRTPKQYFQDNPDSIDSGSNRSTKKPEVRPAITTPSFIPSLIFKKSQNEFDKNCFVKYLISLFGREITRNLISKYKIGTSKHWEGSTVFWQIDISEKVRTGKIMLYNSDTGKRVKKPFSHITWAHKAVQMPDFQLTQCMFGEHLLSDQASKPIAIVESEKTAIIASVYLPQFIWLATGSLNNLNLKICQPLKGRAAAIFPDLNGFDKWSEKAKSLPSDFSFTVSDLLERKATETEKLQGLDLADYLIRFDSKDFTPTQPKVIASKPIEPEQSDESLYKSVCIDPFENSSSALVRKTISWDKEIAELELFFEKTPLPNAPVKIVPYTITDVESFIDSHLATSKAHNGNRTYFPYLERLVDLRNYLTNRN
jgi:hypothetical protein